MNGHIQLKDSEGKVIDEADNIHPEVFIRNILKDYTSPKVPGLPSFTGGFVGYFSYDYLKYSEKKLILDANDDEGFQDVDLMLFDKVIAFDNFKSKLVLIANARTEDIEAGYKKALADIEEMKELILHGEEADIPKTVLKSEFKPLFDKEAYCNMVEKAKRYIYEGDIFQVVLSNRLEAEMEGSLFNTYRVLRSTNPSPYMFYFDGDTIEVAGASPETLVKVENGVLHTFPLAGTRPRGKTKEEDLELEKGLLADAKELAEHNMLVDLGRNDLGKISKFGSVEVERYMTIQRYSHVMHIGSTVKGELADNYDAISAVDAVLPAGTLSGAPKIRACEIINELENNKRGIYGGAIGYIDFSGNLDTCIAIRIAYRKGNKVFVRSGAGIVSDSVPANEFQECINKAKAVTTALIEAQSL
jgi:anthranilate synthase component 1